MTFTVSVTVLPCEHIILNYTTSTAKTGQEVTTRIELQNEVDEMSLRARALAVLYSFIKEQRALGRTWSQVKSDVEAKVYTI